MNQTLRIAHLSDLHISSRSSLDTLHRAGRILERILRMDIDHIVVTGDLTDDAASEDLALARRLFDSHGLLDPHRLTVVIGNHDIFGGVRAAEEIVSFPRRCRTTRYEERVREFITAFAETMQGARTAIPGESYPFAKDLGGVTFVGVNSVAPYSPIVNPIGSNGSVGHGQLQAARGLIREAKQRGQIPLFLIHHHFERTEYDGSEPVQGFWGSVGRQTMRLWGKERILGGLAAEGVGNVLHGHVHETRMYGRGGVRLLNAGGTLMDDGRFGTGFYVLEVRGEEIAAERVRVLDDGAIEWPEMSGVRVFSSRSPAGAVRGALHRSGQRDYDHPQRPRWGGSSPEGIPERSQTSR